MADTLSASLRASARRPSAFSGVYDAQASALLAFLVRRTFDVGQGVIDDQGRAPLFGLATRDVDRVELRYADGPPLVTRAGDGGFVLLVDAWRPMREIVGYDAAGQVLGRADVSKYDLRYLCDKEPGCPTAGQPAGG
jgi:hypothetical protein